MEIAASTTTRDILGLALLAALSERSSTRTEAVDAVRALCLPWLTPTRDVVAGLLSEYCEAGFLRATTRWDRDPGSLAVAPLEVTPQGERELQRLVLYRTGQPAHPLVILCESLRLSVADRLDPSARDEVLRGQIRVRRRCLVMQHRRLAKAGTDNPTLAHTLRHQLACAQAELDALAGVSRKKADVRPALVHSHCRQIARAGRAGRPWRRVGRRRGGRDSVPPVLDMSLPPRIDATFMAIDDLATPDVFVLWALRQRLNRSAGCSGLVSMGFRRVLGPAHAHHALAAFEAANRVLADNGLRRLRLLPPRAASSPTMRCVCCRSAAPRSQAPTQVPGGRPAHSSVRCGRRFCLHPWSGSRASSRGARSCSLPPPPRCGGHSTDPERLGGLS